MRSLGTGSAPLTVWTSEVQISAAVVLTIASSGPGVGTGFSITSVRPISLITNARMVSDTLGSLDRRLEFDPRAERCYVDVSI